jgi:hypothetical protein
VICITAYIGKCAVGFGERERAAIRGRFLQGKWWLVLHLEFLVLFFKKKEQ